MQRKGEVEARVVREEEMYKVERQRQREEHERQKARREEVEATMAENDDVLEKRKRFFEERSSHCPETKLEMQEVIKEEGKSTKKLNKIKMQKEFWIATPSWTVWLCKLLPIFKLHHQTRIETENKQVMEEIQQEKERAGQEERLEKKEPRKLFMRWEYKSPEKKVLAVPNLFFSDGRAFNINEARIPFSLDDSRPDALEVTVQVKIHPPHI